MSGPEDEYQDPHGECAHEIGRLTAELDKARADRDKILEEIEAWKLASGLERGGDPDGVGPSDLEEDQLRHRAELESAMSQIATDNEVCACGCSIEDHEIYEEGIGCGHDDHECLTTCVAIAGMIKGLRDERDALAVEVGRLGVDVDDAAETLLNGRADTVWFSDTKTLYERLSGISDKCGALLEKDGGA